MEDKKKKRPDFVNNSGQGNVPVVKVVSNKFNWGAFYFSWLWGIFNRSYITFTIFIPVILAFILLLLIKSPEILLIMIISEFLLLIWFGIKGNTWAWQNKKWKSIKEFHKVQKNWAVAVLVLVLLYVSSFIMYLITDVPATIDVRKKEYENSELKHLRRKTISGLGLAFAQNYALGRKGTFTSSGLAKYAALGLNIPESNNNYVKDGFGVTYQFKGDGYCLSDKSCFVKIDVNGDKLPNEDGEDIMILRISRKNTNSSLEINMEDRERYMDPLKI